MKSLLLNALLTILEAMVDVIVIVVRTTVSPIVFALLIIKSLSDTVRFILYGYIDD
jgi:hypothetical protein